MFNDCFTETVDLHKISRMWMGRDVEYHAGAYPFGKLVPITIATERRGC